MSANVDIKGIEWNIDVDVTCSRCGETYIVRNITFDTDRDQLDAEVDPHTCEVDE